MRFSMSPLARRNSINAPIPRAPPLERIQRNGFNNPPVKRYLAPCLVGESLGNQRVPFLAQLKDARVALREIALPVGPPKQDKRKEQPSAKMATMMAFTTNAAGQPPELFKNGCHSSIRN